MSHGVPAPGCVLQRSSSSEGNAQSHEDNERKVRRREKNRVAAQRSRKKQTQKADNLHKEYECLEQENTSLKREIGKLTDELKHLSEVLRDHEKTSSGSAVLQGSDTEASMHSLLPRIKIKENR